MRLWLGRSGTGVAVPPSAFPRLRGVNGGLSADLLREHNINCVRIRPNVSWSGTGLRRTPTVNMTAFIALIEALPEGVGVAIDPHTFPGLFGGGTTYSGDPFYWCQELQLNAWDYWAAVAGPLAGRFPNRMIGFECLNEMNVPVQDDRSPWPEFYTSATQYPTEKMDELVAGWALKTNWDPRPLERPTWVLGGRDPRSGRSYVEGCRDAIRGAGNTDGWILYGGWCTGGTRSVAKGGTGVNCGPFADRDRNNRVMWHLDDARCAYTPHLYDPNEYNTIVENVGLVDRPTRDEIVASYALVRAFNLANPTLPFFITEWGTMRGNREPDLYCADMQSVLEEYEWPYIVHRFAFDGKLFDLSAHPGARAVLKAGFDLNDPRIV